MSNEMYGGMSGYPNPYPGSYPGYGYQSPNNGWTYSPKPNFHAPQPLTTEQISKLKQDSSSIDWRVTEEEVLRAICTHKEKNGQSSLIQNPDNTWTCTICGETFPMDLVSIEEVQAAVNTIINMLQIAKALYLDAPIPLLENYFQVIPILKKFPILWKLAVQCSERYYNNGGTGQQPMYNGMNGFQAIGSMFAFNPVPFSGPGYMGGVYGPQPPQNGYPQGGWAPQPAPAPQPYVQPPQNGYPNPDYYQQQLNPFMYNGQPAAAPQQPPAPPPGFIPQQPAPQGTPPAPQPTSTPASDEVVQQKAFNV